MDKNRNPTPEPTPEELAERFVKINETVKNEFFEKRVKELLKEDILKYVSSQEGLDIEKMFNTFVENNPHSAAPDFFDAGFKIAFAIARLNKDVKIKMSDRQQAIQRILNRKE